MGNRNLLLTSFQVLFLIFLIIMVFSVVFMFIFCIIPLRLEALRIFNACTIICAFTVGSCKAVKKLYSQVFNWLSVVFVLSPALVIFGALLFILTIVWGSIDLIFWLEKLGFAVLGSILGCYFGKKLCNFY